jgi:hypothetical protein
MKLYAQHGYGPGDKIISGFADGNIEGVIFSARYTKRKNLTANIEEIRKISPGADILLDPEMYACFSTNLPGARLGGLIDWPYFKNYRRSQLESCEAVEEVLSNTFTTINKLPLSAVIAPNIFIQKSFDSIEAVIAKNFIRRTRPVFGSKKDDRPVYATLALARDALLNLTEFEAFLNDITALDAPPDGFYVLIGGGQSGDRTELTRSEIIHADVIAGWMLLNYTLSLNGFTVINGCSDILTPFLGGVGGYAGATGWWTNLRMFSMNRYSSSLEGGRLPTVRYLSNLILNRITFAERAAYAPLLSDITNGLPHDKDYEGSAPERRIEVLQTWEAIANLNSQMIAADMNDSLSRLESAVQRADAAYGRLSALGFSSDVEANREYISALLEGIKTFKRNAEISKP